MTCIQIMIKVIYYCLQSYSVRRVAPKTNELRHTYVLEAKYIFGPIAKSQT